MFPDEFDVFELIAKSPTRPADETAGGPTRRICHRPAARRVAPWHGSPRATTRRRTGGGREPRAKEAQGRGLVVLNHAVHAEPPTELHCLLEAARKKDELTPPARGSA